MICTLLLAGLVISNAFKSENVYNIVTPRQQIAYRTTNELFADNFKVYSRLTKLDCSYGVTFGANFENSNNQVLILARSDWYIYAVSEISSDHGNNYSSVQQELAEKSQLHPDTAKLLVEP